MANEERSHEIMSFLREHKRATVEELAGFLYVSSATIRRDLTQLQRAGLLERSHGGAVLKEVSDEVSFSIRSSKNANEKIHTAYLAIRHLPSFDTIFIDNSSTCLFLAEKVDFTNKTVVTNSLQLAMHLIAKQRNVHVVLPGGDVTVGGAYSIMGSATVRSVESMHYDLMISSCAALDGKQSYELSMETAALKRTAFEQSAVRILLADNTKLGTYSTYTVAKLHEYDKIFTDAKQEQLESLKINPRNFIHL